MDKRHQRMLEEVVKMPGNETCADCHALAPRWASVNLGVFLCINCASVHRKLGTHRSRVKSVTLDDWSRDQIMTMKSIGNTASNAIYNPNEVLHPPPMALVHEERDSEMEKYIRRKYELGAFKSGAASSNGVGVGVGVTPTSLNRARERDGRLPPGSATGPGMGRTGSQASSSSGPVSSGSARSNSKNPELNDVIAKRDYRDRDLPALPPGATVGLGAASTPPRARPIPSRSTSNSALAAPPTQQREHQLIDLSGGTSSTLPLQVNGHYAQQPASHLNGYMNGSPQPPSFMHPAPPFLSQPTPFQASSTMAIAAGPQPHVFSPSPQMMSQQPFQAQSFQGVSPFQQHFLHPQPTQQFLSTSPLPAPFGYAQPTGYLAPNNPFAQPQVNGMAMGYSPSPQPQTQQWGWGHS